MDESVTNHDRKGTGNREGNREQGMEPDLLQDQVRNLTRASAYGDWTWR